MVSSARHGIRSPRSTSPTLQQRRMAAAAEHSVPSVQIAATAMCIELQMETLALCSPLDLATSPRSISARAGRTNLQVATTPGSLASSGYFFADDNETTDAVAETPKPKGHGGNIFGTIFTPAWSPWSPPRHAELSQERKKPSAIQEERRQAGNSQEEHPRERRDAGSSELREGMDDDSLQDASSSSMASMGSSSDDPQQEGELVESSSDDSLTSALIALRVHNVALQCRIQDLEAANEHLAQRLPPREDDGEILNEPSRQLFTCASMPFEACNNDSVKSPSVSLPQHKLVAVEQLEYVATLESQLNESRRFNKTLTEVCKDLHTKVGDLETKVEDLETIQNSLNEELQESKEREHQLQERLEKTTSRVECMLSVAQSASSFADTPRGRRGKREKKESPLCSAENVPDVADMTAELQSHNTLLKLQNEHLQQQMEEIVVDKQIQATKDGKKIRHLQDKVIKLERVNREYESVRAQLKTQLSALQSKVKTGLDDRESRKTSKDDRSTSELEVEVLRDQLQEASSAAAKQKEQIELLERRGQEQQSQIETLQEEMKARLALEDQVQRNSMTMVATERAMAEARCAALESDIGALQEELHEAAVQTAKYQERVASLENHLFEHERTIQQKDAESSKLRQKIAQFSQVILRMSHDMQSEIDFLERKNEALEHQMKVELDDAETSRNDIQERLLRSLKVMLSTERAIAEANFTLLKRELDMSQENKQILNERASNQEGELRACHLELTNLRVLVDGLQGQLHSTLSEKTKLRASVDKLQHRLDSVQSMNHALQFEIESQRIERSFSTDSTGRSGEHLDQLSFGIQSSGSGTVLQLQEAVSQIASLETKNYELQSRLKDAEKRYSSQLDEQELVKVRAVASLQDDLESTSALASRHQARIEELENELTRAGEFYELHMHEEKLSAENLRKENLKLIAELETTSDQKQSRLMVEERLRRSSAAMVATERAMAIATVAALESELAALKDENRELAAKELQAQEANGSLRSYLSERKRATHNLKRKAQKIQDENTKLRQKLLELSQVIISLSKDMQSKIDVVEQQNDQLKSQLEKENADEMTSRTQIQDQLCRSSDAMIATERAAAEAKYSSLLSNYESLETVLQSEIQRREEAESDVTVLKKENEELASRSKIQDQLKRNFDNRIETERAAAEAEYSSLLADYQAEIRQRENTESDVVVLRNENTELKRRLDEAEQEPHRSQYDALQSEIASLQAQLNLASKQSEEYSKQIDSLRSELGSCSGTAVSSIRESDDVEMMKAKARIDILLSEKEEMGREIRSLNDELASRHAIEERITRSSFVMAGTERALAEAKCSSLEAEVAALKEQMSKVEARATHYKDASELLTDDLSSAKTQSQAQRRKIHRVCDENLKLKKKLLELSQVIIQLSKDMQRHLDSAERQTQLLQDQLEYDVDDERAAHNEITIKLRHSMSAMIRTERSKAEAIATFLSREIEDLRDRLAMAENDTAHQSETLEQSRHSTAAIASTERSIGEARMQLLVLEAENYRDQLQLTSTQLLQSQAQIESLQEELRGMGNENKNAILQLKAAHCAELAAAARKTAALRTEKDELRNQIQTLEENLASLRATEARTRQSFSSIVGTERAMAEARFASLESEIAELHAEVRDATEINSDYQNHVEELKLALSTSEAETAANREIIQKIDAENHMLKSKLLAIGWEKAMANTKCSALEMELGQLRTEYTSIVPTVSKLENVTEKLRQELLQSEAELNKKSELVRDTQSENDRLKSKLVELSAVISQLTGEMQDSVEGLERQKSALALELELELEDERQLKNDIHRRIERGSKAMLATERAIAEARITVLGADTGFRLETLVAEHDEDGILINSLLDSRRHLETKLDELQVERQAEVSSVRKELAAAGRKFEAEAKILRESFQSLKATEIHTRRSLAAIAGTERAIAQAKCSVLESDLNELKIELEKAVESSLELERQNTDLKCDLSIYKEEAEKYESTINTLLDGNSKLKMKLLELSQVVVHVSKDMQVRIDASEIEKSALQKQLERVQGAESEIQDRLKRSTETMLLTERMAAGAEIAELKRKLAKLEAKAAEDEKTSLSTIEDLNSQRQSLQGELKRREGDVNRLLQKTRYMKSEKETLTAKLYELSDVIGNLSNQMQTNMSAMEEENTKLQADFEQERETERRSRNELVNHVTRTTASIVATERARCEAIHTLLLSDFKHSHEEHRMRLQEAISANEKLNDKLAASMRHIDSLNQENNRLRDHVQIETATRKDKEFLLSSLTTEKMELSNMLNNAQAKLSLFGGICAESRRRLESLYSTEKSLLEARCLDLTKELEACNRKLDSTSGELELSQTKVESLHLEIRETCKTHAEEMAAAREKHALELNSASSKIELLQRQAVEQQNLVSDLRAEAMSKQAFEDTLLRTTEAAIENERAMANVTCSALEADVSMLRAALQRATETATEYQKLNDSLKAQLSSSNAVINEKQAEIHKFEIDTALLKAELQSIYETANTFEELSNRLKNELSTSAADNDEKSAMIQTIQDQNTSMQSKLVELSQVIGDLSESVEELQKQKQQLEADSENALKMEREVQSDLQSRLSRAMKVMITTDRARTEAEQAMLRATKKQLDVDLGLKSAELSLVAQELEKSKLAAFRMQNLNIELGEQLKASREEALATRTEAAAMFQNMESELDSRDSRNNYLQEQLESQHKDYLELQKEFQRQTFELAGGVEELAEQLERKVAEHEVVSKRLAKADSQVESFKQSLSDVSKKLKDTTLLYSETQKVLQRTEQQLVSAQDLAKEHKEEADKLKQKLDEFMSKNTQLDDERTLLSAQVEDLSNSKALLEAQVAELNETLTSTTEEKNRFELQSQELTTANSSLESQLEKATGDIASLEKDLDETRNKLRGTQSENRVLEEALQRRILEVGESRNHVNELKKRLNDLQTTVDDAFQQNNHLKSTSQSDIGQLRREVDRQQQELRVCRAEARELVARIAALEPELQQVREEKENLEQELLERQEEIEDAQVENTDLQHLIEKQDKIIKQLETDAADRDEQAKRKQARFEEMKASLASVTGVLEEMTDSNTALATRINHLEAELEAEKEAKSKALADTSATNFEKESALTAATAKIEHLREEIRHLENKIRTLEQESREQLVAARKEIDKASQREATLVENLDACKAELSTLRQAAEENENALTEQINVCRNEVSEEKFANRLLKDLVSTLNTKNDSLQTKCDKLKADKKDLKEQLREAAKQKSRVRSHPPQEEADPEAGPGAIPLAGEHNFMRGGAEERLVVVTRERDSLQQRVKDLTEKESQALKKLEAALERNKRLDDQLTETKNKVTELTKAIETMTAEHALKLGNSEAREASLAKEVVGLQLEIETVRRKLKHGGHDELQDILMQETEDMRVKLDELKRENQQLKSSLRERGSSEEIEEMRIAFEEDLAHFEAREASLAREVVALQLEVESTKRRLAQVESNPNDYQRRINELRADVLYLTKENEALAAEREASRKYNKLEPVVERREGNASRGNKAEPPPPPPPPPMDARACRKQSRPDISGASSFSSIKGIDSVSSFSSAKQSRPNHISSASSFSSQKSGRFLKYEKDKHQQTEPRQDNRGSFWRR